MAEKKEVLCNTLVDFLRECQKEDGQRYPEKTTLFALVLSLQKHYDHEVHVNAKT